MIPSQIAFAPLLPWSAIGLLAGMSALVVAFAFLRRARGAALRMIPLGILLLALINPRLTAENRQPLDDVAIVVMDESASQGVGDRRQSGEAALAGIEKQLRQQQQLEVRVERVQSNRQEDKGTQLFGAIERVTADIPKQRLAGVILVTDGRVHDVPLEDTVGAPVHALLTGRPGERDRRVTIEQSPGYGIVGQSVRVELRVHDTGGQGSAQIWVRRDGGPPVQHFAPLNQPYAVDVPIEHAGQTVLEIEVESANGELSTLNNRTALAINGVRDRMRVLLISGEPHAGERMWRNMLKADPSVDLVHFTILRPPEKDDNTPLRELALISFPVRELFEEKLKDFDLIIFDRYRRRGVLPTGYYNNLARYVRGGGAMLVSVGPEYSDMSSLWQTPLREVLPAAPSGQTVIDSFVPRIAEGGRRHPVSAGLPGSEADPPKWGPWLRAIGTEARRGRVVMEGVGNLPLVVLDNVGEGRIAQIMSDTVWLWARGYDGGGPQVELLRRLAHWLMKEPDLEEEQLRAEIRGGELHVLRRSLESHPEMVSVERPDGSTRPVRLADLGDGRATGSLPVTDSGLYRVNDGVRTTVAAAGTINPVEMSEITATPDLLVPIAETTGGSIRWLSDGGMPDIRRVKPDRSASGRGWIGLRANGAHVVTGVAEISLVPAGMVLLLAVGGLLLAWRREGR